MVKLPDPLQGFHATTYNTTADAVRLRRDDSLQLFSDACASNQALPDLWDAIIRSIAEGDGDLSFAALYTAKTELRSEAGIDSVHIDSQNYLLHGTVGSFETSSSEHLRLEPCSMDKHIAAMHDAATSGHPVLLKAEGGTLPEQWRQASRSRCYGDECIEAVVLPSALSSNPESQAALLVVGLAPRRPYDDGYEDWIKTIHRQFANTVTSVTLSEARALEKKNMSRRADREKMILENHAKLQQVRLEEAIEARRQQENFIDTISHEIRNPLGAVMHCADSASEALGRMQKLFETTTQSASTLDTSNVLEVLRDIADSVDTISACSNHQKRITDDILSLSKLDSNLLEVCPSAFQVGKCLAQVQDTFRVEAKRVKVTLDTLYDPSLKLFGIDWILADPGRINQVLVNLVTNAIKFTKNEAGDRKIMVRVGASRTLDMQALDNLIMTRGLDGKTGDIGHNSEDSVYLWFTVKDTGCGMDAAGRSKIFSRFSQASPKTYNKYGGSGLGLFISKKLVELQGGEIGFTSEANSGSTFAFYIKAHQTVSSVASETLPATSDNQTPTKNGTLPFIAIQLNVLLVEDNKLNQKVLKKQLTRNNFNVFTADDGQEAFDFIKTSRHWKGMAENETAPRIDVILMDIEMPVVDGLTCAMIRSARLDGDINVHLPIIAVTANARPEQLRRAIDVGMDDAVSKPFRIGDIIPVIERLVIQPKFNS